MIGVNGEEVWYLREFQEKELGGLVFRPTTEE